MSSRYAGIDLCSSDHRVCEVSVEPARGHFTVGPSTTFESALPPIWSKAADLLRVREPVEPGRISRLNQALKPDAARLVTQLVRAAGRHDGLAVAVPYAIDPLTLASWMRSLHEESPPASLSEPQFIEAPAALVLDLLAEREVSPGDCLLTLTPSAAGLELAALRIKLEVQTLVLEVLAFHEICDPLSVLAMKTPSAVRGHFGQQHDVSASTVHACVPLLNDSGALGLIASRFDKPPTRCRAHPLERLQSGAARYAALVSRCPLPGMAFTSMRIERVLPRPIGIIGVNSENERFWRLLFAAGMPYTPPLVCQMGIDANQAGAEFFLSLAEVRRFNGHVPRWLSHKSWDEWELSLYYHKSLPTRWDNDGSDVLPLSISLYPPTLRLLLADQAFAKVSYKRS